MKKIFLLIICMFLLVGCSSEEEIKNSSTENETITNEVSDELKDPIIEWCKLYNPNGYNTVTCVISNPNSVDIDISYDLVFYKDGQEVYRTEDKWSNYQISNTHNDVIWGNVDIPSSEEANEVKMENITVTKSYYNSINADISYIGLIDGNAVFSVINETKPTLNNIFVFEYNDENNNKKCDKDELVVVNIQSVTEKETQIKVNANVYNASSYEVYYNAY